MEFDLFLDGLASEVFYATPRQLLNKQTEYMDLDEWSSLTAFSLISYIEKTYRKRLLLPDLLAAQTLEDLYRIVKG